MNRVPRFTGVRLWAALGLLGSALMAIAGASAVADPGTPWWYRVGALGGHAATVLVYVGAAILCVAWLGLGTTRAQIRPRHLLAVAGLWTVPLLLGPVLFSHDAYSYLAQGTVLHLGHNPYHDPPSILARLGHARTLAGVSPFWRGVTAPYGPLFLGVMSLITSITGQHLIPGILLVRVVDLVGLGLVAWAVPRLARALGSDPGRALWLSLLCPLVLLELITAAHNDVLMAGLLAAGVAVALQGRPVLGVALCVMAATIKVPALAGAVFIAVAWVREERTWSARAVLLLRMVAGAAVVLAAVSLITGLGFSWLSSSLFAAPARVRLAITPSTQIGYSLAGLLHGLGVGANARSVEAVCSAVTTVLAGLLGLWLLSRVRVAKLVPYLGGLLLVAAAAGPAAWPWYFSWGLVLLAAYPPAQRSPAIAVGAVVAVFLIKPNGILALPLSSAPVVMAIYIVLAVLFWRSRHGRRRELRLLRSVQALRPS